MTDRPIALLLPGQGAQYQGMAVELYEREPVFSAVIDEFFHFMGAEGDRLRNDWLAESPAVPIDDGTRAQPLLFAIGYAIGRVLESRGVRPAVLIGHSVGELGAAALAEVFGLPSAARILAARSRSLRRAPRGGMLAVAASPQDCASRIDPSAAAQGVVVGAVNAPLQTIVAGPEEPLARTERALGEAGLTVRRVRARQPWHSPALSPAAEEFERAIAGEPLRPPAVPIRSARTAGPVGAREALEPAFWARQMAEPVLFWPALSGLLDEGEFTLVETGPGKGLSAAARRHPSVRTGRSEVVALLPAAGGDAWRTWQTGLDRLSGRAGEPAAAAVTPPGRSSRG